MNKIEANWFDSITPYMYACKCVYVFVFVLMYMFVCAFVTSQGQGPFYCLYSISLETRLSTVL